MTKVRFKTSTGVGIEIWREGQLFHAARGDAFAEPQICLGIDLFEIVAELTGLDLERPVHAEEATQLAGEAQDRLATDARSDEPPVERREGVTTRAPGPI